MYRFVPMTDEYAKEIAFEWKYDGEYSFYDMTADEEDLEEFLQPDKSGYFAVEREGRLIGFFSFQNPGDGILDIGLGMKPDITGKGQGFAFLQEGMKFAVDAYQPELITLSVAAFNERAIKVYDKAGFKRAGIFMQETNGSTYEFLKMKLDLKENQDVFIASRF
ncbi:N-acetyltransferase [Bacillus salacetis]|uniref:N-acetyltransferase n=1 Tax=Bacillus salacetis TaxID=2315464 RepID=A0A3A1R3J4_9BACI|nr:GNAT family protein [Bacillus salacetis]RIW37288.1 N-acetyltransferase [Bacillus salacetis]